jgi:hypothetical protein
MVTGRRAPHPLSTERRHPMDATTVLRHLQRIADDPTVLEHDWLRIQRTGENSCNLQLKARTFALEDLRMLAKLLNLAAMFYEDGFFGSGS